jgi:hypothetical protein
MHTNVDDEFDIPEVTDFSGFRPSPHRRRQGEPREIIVDGATGYSLRLIPSNKVVGRFASTTEAWPAVIAELERGIPARCLVLDCHLEEGRRGRVGSGRLLALAAMSTLPPGSTVRGEPVSDVVERSSRNGRTRQTGAAFTVVTRPSRRRSPVVTAGASRG